MVAKATVTEWTFSVAAVGKKGQQPGICPPLRLRSLGGWNDKVTGKSQVINLSPHSPTLFLSTHLPLLGNLWIAQNFVSS